MLSTRDWSNMSGRTRRVIAGAIAATSRTHREQYGVGTSSTARTGRKGAPFDKGAPYALTNLGPSYLVDRQARCWRVGGGPPAPRRARHLDRDVGISGNRQREIGRASCRERVWISVAAVP